MMKERYDQVCKKTDLRANLIEIKKQIRDGKGQKELKRVCGDRYDVFMKCLIEEDPKVRKNAAAILGAMKVQEALDVLYDAYVEENTLFVKADYIEAMAQLNCKEYLPAFQERLQELTAISPEPQDAKHVNAEIHAIQELLLSNKAVKKHVFKGTHETNDVILTTLPAFRDALAEKITSKKTLLKSGVRTMVSDLNEIMEIRIWQEMLFCLDCGGKQPKDPEALALILAASNLKEILLRNHQGEGPFYFRISVTGAMEMEERGAYIKKISQYLEQATGRFLVNTASHYEVELRLQISAEGLVLPLMKLYTVPDVRFHYRKYHVAASMKPYMAAGLLALAKPYLREYAQVLDPFCGVGTMLMERRFVSPMRNGYGIDTFGEAIDKARLNAKEANFQMNYINRNYFDFQHDYLFDEIITDMPAGNLEKEELERIYRLFFQKSAELLEENGRMVVFSREMGLVKKNLRVGKQFRLLQEFTIQEKNGSYLFILEKSTSA